MARGTNKVLVHRNELNEQQRPGTIVQLPQQVKGTGIRCDLCHLQSSADW